jgi:hypothetical protein
MNADRVKRLDLELRLLATLSMRPAGAPLGELREAFPGSPVTHTLDHLVDRGQVRRFEGVVYGIEEKGRSRLSPA